jgi:hypothetical protein
MEMKISIADISQRKVVKIAGLGYLIIIIAGFFAFSVLSTLLVPGDAAKTAKNIEANQGLFRVMIISFLIMVMFDVVVGLALYVILKPVNNKLSLLAVIFRLIQAIFIAISMVYLLIEPLLFNDVYLIGQIFFALYLLVLGYLVWKPSYIPRILGILLIIGGVLGYLLESLIYFFFPDYVAIAIPGLVVGTIAEISLSLWLLLRGDKIPEKTNYGESL